MAHVLLYGGTFDPVHHGHLITCRAAREYLAADLVVLIPAWVSPHKVGAGWRAGANPLAQPTETVPPWRAGGASAAQRLEMLRLAVAGDAGFTVDERELTRGAAAIVGGKPSYTIDTVEELLREKPTDRLTLLIGADQLPKLHTWQEAERLFTMVEVGVLGRPSDRSLQAAMVAVRQHLGAKIADRLTLLPTPLVEISATEIRRRVRERLSIAYLVPEKVAEYIDRERLYRG